MLLILEIVIVIIFVTKSKMLITKQKTAFGTNTPQQIISKGKRADLKGGVIYLSFSPDKITKTKVKTIPFCVEQKTGYTCKLTFEAIFKLKALGFTFNSELLAFYNYYFTKKNLTIPKITGLKYDLFQYQKEGLAYIDHFKGRCLVADEQGLGKTIQAIAWAEINDIFPILVCCPSSLKLNWKNEFTEWLQYTPSVQVISGYENPNNKTNITADVVIINYDILTTKVDKKVYIRTDIADYPFQLIIADEAHYINNIESMRGEAMSLLANKVKYFIALTATPSKNKPKNLYHLLNMINDKVFPNEYRFYNRYCNPKKGYKGKMIYDGVSNEEELNTILTNTLMFRRRKLDIFKELDRKIRQVIPLEIDNRAEYDEYDISFAGDEFAKIEGLKQLAVKGKMKQVFDFIDLQLTKTEKVVVFAEHHQTIDLLMEKYGKLAVKIDGRTSNKKKEEAKNLFQRCKKCGIKKEYHSRDVNACTEYEYDMTKRVIIGSTSMCEGHTLTASDVVIFTELWWGPQDHDQAEDRCYGRAGDLHGCTCYYLIAVDTIEENIAKVYDLKNKMSAKVLDGRELDKEEILTELLKIS